MLHRGIRGWIVYIHVQIPLEKKVMKNFADEPDVAPKDHMSFVHIIQV